MSHKFLKIGTQNIGRGFSPPSPPLCRPWSNSLNKVKQYRVWLAVAHLHSTVSLPLLSIRISICVYLLSSLKEIYNSTLQFQNKINQTFISARSLSLPLFSPITSHRACNMRNSRNPANFLWHCNTISIQVDKLLCSVYIFTSFAISDSSSSNAAWPWLISCWTCVSSSIKARIYYTKFYRKDNIYSPKSTKHLLNDDEFVTRCRCLIHAAPDPKTF